MKSHLIITFAILLCSACTSGSSAPTSDLDATLEIALEQTIAAQPTPTSTITPTQKPTNTSVPISTKIPTQAVPDEVKSFTVETMDDGYSHYSYDDAGFSVSLPHNWEHLDISADDLDIVLRKRNQSTNGRYLFIHIPKKLGCGWNQIHGC